MLSRSHRNFTRLAFATAAATALMSGAALAQDAATQTNPQNSAAAPTGGQTPNSANPSASSSFDADLVVTAQKRAENVQDVPQGVSVVSAQALQDLHITSLQDLGAYLPGVQINNTGSPGQTIISIRGIAPVGPGATVGTYIDDTPIGGSSNYSRAVQFALDLLPYDVQRLEVLRGPQGTLYGASTMGGVLKYVLTSPDLENIHVRAGAETFNLDHAQDWGWGVRASVNAPIVDDKVGFLASYALEKTPGFIDNPTTGNRDINGLYQESGRFDLLLKPTDKLSVNLDVLAQRIVSRDDDTEAVNPVTLQPLYGEYQDGPYIHQPFKKSIQYYSGSINYDLGWGNLVSATSYSYVKTYQVVDASLEYGILFPLFGVPSAGLSEFDLNLSLKKFTQEIRLQSPTGSKLEWLVGGFYTDETSTNHQIATAQYFDGSPIVGLDPLAIVGLPSTYKEYAGFGDLTYHITDKFDVSAGARYAHNEQTFEQISSGALLGGVVTDQPGTSSEGVATYSADARYHVTPDAMIYARVASGYQPGGPNVVLPGVQPQVESSRLTNYEIGLKSEWWDHRLLFNITAFLIDWSKIQVAAISEQGVSYLTNGGTARSEGIEANAQIKPTQDFSLAGSLAYTDAKLTADAATAGGFDGDPLPNIPKWSGSVTGDWSHPLSNDWTLHLGGGVRMTGKRLSDFPTSPYVFKLPGYAALDLDAHVSNSRYTLRLFAKNVTGEHKYITGGTLVNGLTGGVSVFEPTLLEPREVGFAVDASF